jgi:hypothetical protein
LERHAGTQFDPDVVAAFLRVPPADWEELRARSLPQGRPGTRADHLLTEKFALAAASSSNGKHGVPSVPKNNRLTHRSGEMRTLAAQAATSVNHVEEFSIR